MVCQRGGGVSGDSIMGQQQVSSSVHWQSSMLVNAQKHITSREILLWMTPSEAPKALQASACNELLGPTGASCWIFAQH